MPAAGVAPGFPDRTRVGKTTPWVSRSGIEGRYGRRVRLLPPSVWDSYGESSHGERDAHHSQATRKRPTVPLASDSHPLAPFSRATEARLYEGLLGLLVNAWLRDGRGGHASAAGWARVLTACNP